MFSSIFFLSNILCSIEIEVVSTTYNEIVTPGRFIVKPETSELDKSNETPHVMSIITLFAWVTLLTIFGGGIINACFNIPDVNPKARLRNYLIAFVVSLVILGVFTTIKIAFRKK